MLPKFCVLIGHDLIPWRISGKNALGDFFVTNNYACTSFKYEPMNPKQRIRIVTMENKILWVYYRKKLKFTATKNVVVYQLVFDYDRSAKMSFNDGSR